MTTLIVAAGGGGDAITGSALSRLLGLVDPPVVMTYSWDRLMIDPLPGPRSADDFTGLKELALHVLEVLASTTPTPPAGSSLPRLAATLSSRLLLLDPTEGALGMATQIQAAAEYFGASSIALIDVGGDAVTNGNDPGLRSPLADQLSIAACVCAGIPTRLLIAAPGIDGELPPATILARLAANGAAQLPDLTADDFESVRPVFAWHPSEASGLLAAAASGRRGSVEVRDAGDQIELTDATPSVFAVDILQMLDSVPAADLTASQSLAEAEAIIKRNTGISEIGYEAQKANDLSGREVCTLSRSDLVAVDHHAKAAALRGSDFISMRRLAELLHATTLDAFAAASALLAAERPDRYEPSLYRVL